ncbi:hypothetical protein PPUJ20005_44740 [Pseudomonas putida]|nr:hypothetical protein PPUJ20005_44740 [Pseudomonas putida]GLO25458.1 hypothetical protein PPUJ21368_32870 [Pseudomonas putida]
MRPPVDQVTHTEQAVYRGVESHRFKALFQALEVTMDIAHRQVTPPDIGEQSPKPSHYNLPLQVLPWRA